MPHRDGLVGEALLFAQEQDRALGLGQRRQGPAEPGQALVISSSGMDNGCYGFFDFPSLFQPPFVTVPSTGSIGEAAVQTYPCGVADDCLILVPKDGTAPELLYIAAATLRHEAWRFDYGRKMTPKRIAEFVLPTDGALLEWVERENAKAEDIEGMALDAAEGGYSDDHDRRDAEIAVEVMMEIDAGRGHWSTMTSGPSGG